MGSQRIFDHMNDMSYLKPATTCLPLFTSHYWVSCFIKPAHATRLWHNEALIQFVGDNRLRINMDTYDSRWEYAAWKIEIPEANTEIVSLALFSLEYDIDRNLEGYLGRPL